MHRALVLCVFLAGCSTITVNNYGDNNRLTIEQPKTVTASPYAAATGNTIPVSAIPK
jgi:PBP1b-binding outer membrane lipoprotein LpoB